MFIGDHLERACKKAALATAATATMVTEVVIGLRHPFSHSHLSTRFRFRALTDYLGNQSRWVHMWVEAWIGIGTCQSIAEVTWNKKAMAGPVMRALYVKVCLVLVCASCLLSVVV